MSDRVRRVRRTEFPSFHRVVVPVIHGCDSPAALELAQALAPEVVLLGMVRVGADEVLSAGAARASDVRRTLRQIVTEADGRTRARARVRVSETPWPDLQHVLVTENSDLLVLEWPTHLQAMALEEQVRVFG